MPAGSNQKREREYKELKSEFKKEHRYPGREDEVAARIVNKQRAQAGETQGARKGARKSAKKSSASTSSSKSGRKSARKSSR